MRRLDLAGRRFGRLLVIELASGRDKSGGVIWRCSCDCGAEKLVASGALNGRGVRSCGCLHIETAAAVNRKHGQYKTRTYSSWLCMIQRCTNPKQTEYKNYGGRGITVCQRWRESFEAFHSDMGQRPIGTTLDRKDYDGNYEPGNCRWATPVEQSNNTRVVTKLTVDGETRTLHEWARLRQVNPRTIQKRLNLGWSDQRAVAGR